jgi:HlyD family secretion protein
VQARAALQQARDDRQRAERLLPSGGIAEADVERLILAERGRQADLEASEARQRAAGHDVRAAQSALLAAGSPGGQLLAVSCPMGGRILAIPDQSARTVAPGEVLLEVGDPTDLEIVVDLLSTDAVRVTPGDRLLVTGWGGEGTLEGRVLRVDPAGFTKISALGVEEQRVNVIGVLDSIPTRLGDRFRVEVRVVLWEEDAVLQVPSSALFRRGSEWAVFVVEGGRARERVVRMGQESGSDSQVLEGLAAGELVVRHPTDRVMEGVRVRGRDQ